MDHLIVALKDCCSCPPDSQELGTYLDHIVVGHQDDVGRLMPLARLFGTYPNQLAFVPLQRLDSNENPDLVVAWLRLLKVVLCLQNTPFPSLWLNSSCHTLLNLINGPVHTIKPLVIEVISLVVRELTFIEPTPVSGHLLQLAQSIRDAVWTTIDASITGNEAFNADIFKAWIKWLGTPEGVRPTTVLIQSSQYASCLKKGLNGSSQETQKLCLYILRQSHSILDEESKRVLGVEASQEVNRYSRAFETIIMGGYPIQALECLDALEPDLLLRASTTNSLAVDGSWWILLASVSLASSGSDNTQKNTGYWVLRHQFNRLPYDASFARFIREDLLSWASQGSLFHSTTKRNKYDAICRHGDELSSFIFRLLYHSVGLEARQKYVELVFASLQDSTTSAYALIFILQGLARFFKRFPDSNAYPNIGNHADNLMSPNSKMPLTKTQRYVIKTQLAFISQYLELGRSWPIPVPFNVLDINYEGQSLRHDVQHHIDHFGLEKGCQSLEALLSNSSDDLTKMLLQDDGEAFNFLWSESSRNRHPREVAVLLPRIFFATSVVKASEICPALQLVVFKAISDMFSLSQTRIYVWNAFTQEIRRTYFAHDGYGPFIEAVEKLLTDFVRLPPAPTHEYLLEYTISKTLDDQPPNGSLMEVTLNEGLGHAYLFDILNRLKFKDLSLGLKLIDNFLQPWLAPPSRQMDKTKCIFALQGVTILAQRCIQKDEDVPKLIDLFKTAISNEKSPRYRYLLEWAITTCYWSFNQNIEEHAMKELKILESAFNDEIAPRDIVSQLKLSISISRHPNIGNRFVETLMGWIPSLCSSSKVAIRFEALYAVVQVMRISATKNFSQITTNFAYNKLNQHALSLLESKGLPLSRQMESFDALTDQCLATLFEGSYQQLENHAAGPIRAEDFQTIVNDAVDDLETAAMPIGDYTPVTIPNEASKLPLKEVTSAADATYQSKSFAVSDHDIEIEHVPIPRTKEIILVASLIDSPINIGGLCRAAEIYGCSELHVPFKNIVNDKAFARVSVSSESHITIIHTSPLDLVAYLTGKRLQGYTILGVEQTDSSLILGADNTKLPQKVVLVMGAERTGIPANILVECDQCVEMKQWGVTRSLNVQTAAATVLYEWRRQHG